LLRILKSKSIRWRNNWKNPRKCFFRLVNFSTLMRRRGLKGLVNRFFKFMATARRPSRNCTDKGSRLRRREKRR